MALRRGQDVAPDEEMLPMGVGQIAATLEHAHELVGRIRNPGGPRLPAADRALADPEQISAGRYRQQAGVAGFPEAGGSDRKSLPFGPVGVPKPSAGDFA